MNPARFEAPAPPEQQPREEREGLDQGPSPAATGFTPGFYVGFASPDDPNFREHHPPQQHPGGASTAESAAAPVSTAPPPPVTDVPEQREPNIEDILSKVVIHTHKPMENLPEITPPELKIIGRAVTFKGETKVGEETVLMHYEGLVGTINKDTVMLIHVHRFTEEDFQIHKLEVKEQKDREDRGEKGASQFDSARKGAKSAEPPAGGVDTTVSPTHREEAEGEQPEDGIDAGDGLDMGRESPHGNPVLALPNAISGNDHNDTNQRVRNRMRDFTGSMGPIPYMTFSRSRIHEVEFATDPRSSFYSLFRDPSKRFFDMQCLRMFCRRYIVHTTQGNNPRQVPLRAFVTCRCNCPDLDNDLLARTTYEEIAHLVKVDRDARRAKKRTDVTRRNVLRTYRAPRGLFQNTGALYLTHIPRQTFFAGLLEVIMALVIGVYASVFFVKDGTTFTRAYVNKYVPLIIPGIVLGVAAGISSLMHATRMRLPMSTHLALALARVFLVTAAIGTNLMSMIALGRAFQSARVRESFASLTLTQVCQYYDRYNCLGFDPVVCDFGDSTMSAQPIDNPPICSCITVNYLAGMAMIQSCRNQVMGTIERGLIPIVCFTLVLFVFLWFDHFLHYKLFYIGRLLARRM